MKTHMSKQNFLFVLLLTFFTLACSTNKEMSKPKVEIPAKNIQSTPTAKYVWFDTEGSGRHQYVYFALENKDSWPSPLLGT